MPSDKILNWVLAGLVLLCLILAAAAVAHSGTASDSPTDEHMTAVWTRNQALITMGTGFVVLVFSLVQAMFIVRADQTTRTMAQAALDANRPWLDLNADVGGPLKAAGGRAEMKCIVHMRNLGNSPAAWTDVTAFIEHLNQNTNPTIIGQKGASVLQGGNAERTLMAPLYDLKTRDVLGESHLVLRVRVEYPLPGREELGATVRSYEITASWEKAIDLGDLPVPAGELSLTHIEFGDVIV